MAETGKEAARQARPAAWPAWARALMVLALLVLAVSISSEAGAFGHSEHAIGLGDLTYQLLSTGAALAALAAAWLRRDLWGWGLVALGLLANAAGELVYQFAVDPIDGAYPSAADYLYFAFYLLVIAGVHNLARRGSGRLPVAALLTPLLGLAALWSAFVFDPVLGGLEGSTAARMTTAAYPSLDLLLIFACLLALAAHGWRLDTSMLLLIAGAVTIGVADATYTAWVAHGSIPEQSPIDSLWPLGAMLIALAPWAASDKRPERVQLNSRVELALAVPAVIAAAAILVLDHYSRLDDITVALAAATLIAAAGRLVALYLEAERANLERDRFENLHSASAEAALEAIITVDRQGRVVDWNPAAERIFGYFKDEAMGQNISELSVPEGIREDWQDAFERFASGNAQHLAGRRFEMTGMRKDGGEVPIEVTIARVSDDPPLFTSFIADISERRQREAERERLAQMVRSAEDAMYSTDTKLTVIAWNPAAERIYGYRADEIMGKKLERLVPAEKRDEMWRLAHTVASGEAVAVETKRLRKDGEVIDVALQIYPVRDELGSITGYSSILRDITDRREREREQRLHRERAAWRSQIEDALEQGNFEFHRQPVLELESGRIAHHELLMRMRLDDQLVPPGQFLPHAESSPPLMRRLDRWAIREGIALAAERPVAINLSARSLSDAGIAKAVQGALESSGADPRDVTFEITETAAAEQLEDAHALVSALRALGCGVALDDFGTGYGSFTYLLRMPVTSLKIDMDFIKALSEDPADQRVVGSILAVARNFGLTTVAEGVEEEDTLRLLREMGVDEVQGYLVGRPSPEWASEAEMRELLSSSGGR